MTGRATRLLDVARLAKGSVTASVPADVWRTWQRRRAVAEWEAAGRPIPPPSTVKHALLLEHARSFDLSLLVETGTFWGETVAAMRRHFRQVTSIELEPRLARHCRRRFARFRNVEIVHGDSARELKRVVSQLRGRTLFWLDGHDSGGDTAATEPLADELIAVMNAPVGSVVLVDDARTFTGPPRMTIDEIASLTQEHFTMAVRDDVIRLTPLHISRPPA
jgi:hypothetical protein